MGRPSPIHAVDDALDASYTRVAWNAVGAEVTHFGTPGYRAIVSCGPLGRSDQRVRGHGTVSCSIEVQVAGRACSRPSSRLDPPPAAGSGLCGALETCGGLQDLPASGTGTGGTDGPALEEKAQSGAGLWFLEQDVLGDALCVGSPEVGHSVVQFLDASWGPLWGGDEKGSALVTGHGTGRVEHLFGRAPARAGARHGA